MNISKLKQFLCSPGIFRLFLASVVVIDHASSLALGVWAVNVFFMLSGYWVTRMYQSKYSRYRYPACAFYLSRYLRLIPVYLVCLILMLIAITRVDPHQLAGSIRDAAWWFRSLIFVSSASQYQPLGPAWSLDIEVQFYLLLPLLLLLLDRMPRGLQARTAFLTAVLLFPLTLTWGSTARNLLYAHISFFCFGIANAYRPFTTSFRWGVLSFASFVLLCLLVIALPAWRGLIIGGSHPANPALFAHNSDFSSVAAILIGPYVSYSLNLKSAALDRHLGNLAYPVYLFHWIPETIMASMVVGLSIRRRIPYVLLDFVVVAIGSLILYLAVDLPCERFRSGLIHRVFGASGGKAGR